LIFIFWPLDTERALDESVWGWVCPKARGERASARPKASAIDLIVFDFIFVSTPSSMFATRSLTAPVEF
jgi:hypothetical protein